MMLSSSFSLVASSNNVLSTSCQCSAASLPITLCEVQGWVGGDRPGEHVPGEDEGGGHEKVHERE